MPDEPPGCAQKGLHVVANLMRDYVSPREVAGGAELVFHVFEKRQVDIQLVVPGAVEGPRSGLGMTARRADGVWKQHQFRLGVGPVHCAEFRVPHLLCLGQHNRHKLDQLPILFGQLRPPGVGCGAPNCSRSTPRSFAKK